VLRVPAFLRPVFSAVRANFVPGLCLQALALFVVLAYELSSDVRHTFDQLGRAKEAAGFFGPVVSTAIFGGLVPYLFLLTVGRIRPGRRAPEFWFYLLFWAYKGFEIDLLYRSQSVWFGEAQTLKVIGIKTLIDQGLYGTLWAAPTQTLLFLWKDAGFSLREVRVHLAEQPLRERLLVILASNWIVWIPAVAIIYALPTALQILLSNLVLTFWTLILTFVSQKSRAEPAEGPAPS
jgi:hypothetical protein